MGLYDTLTLAVVIALYPRCHSMESSPGGLDREKRHVLYVIIIMLSLFPSANDSLST